MSEVSQQEPITDLTNLVHTWRGQAVELDAEGAILQAGRVRTCAEQLEQVIRRTLADAVAASETDTDRAAVARVRITEASDRRHGPRHTAESREEAAQLLAEIWAVAESFGVRPVDWLGTNDLAASCLDVVALVARRTERQASK